MKTEMICVRNITKRFQMNKAEQKALHTKEKYKIAVDDLSFDVEKGEIFGILGPNGAGKTTTLRILSTLLKPDSGTIQIGGMDTTRDSEKIRKNMAFLTDDLKLDARMTPAYLFRYFATLYGEEMSTRERQERLFSYFGIADYAETEVGRLSTGMRQKAALAISVAHDPDIIIFDEPTNGLDIVASKLVVDFLAELREQGKTIILSSHIFDVIERLCDRVLIMLDGQKCMCEPLDAITSENSLETVFFDLYYGRNSGE